jgi:predicted Abi (CAAX) family protease
VQCGPADQGVVIRRLVIDPGSRFSNEKLGRWGNGDDISSHLLAAVDETLLGGRDALLLLDEVLDLGDLLLRSAF